MEIIIGILGLIIAFVTLKLTFFSKPIEEFNHLKLQFKANQRLSLDVQNELENYIEKFSSENHFMFENITFQNYLDELKNSHSKNLSNKLLEELVRLDLPKSTISSMNKSLEIQFNSLLEVQTRIRLLKKASIND